MRCCLDPAPKWLVKQLLPLLAETLAKICNASFSEEIFPDSLKQAIVRTRLKKPTLNPNDLNSYRPISNWSFLSKVVERVAAVRLSAHIESQQLLPCRQSAYRAGHSTETVHDEIVYVVSTPLTCVRLFSLILAPHLIQSTIRHFFASLVTVLESKMQHLTGVSRTSLKEHRESVSTHSNQSHSLQRPTRVSFRSHEVHGIHRGLSRPNKQPSTGLPSVRR